MTKLNFTVGDCGKAKEHPDLMINAIVPGSIQQDFAEYYNYEDFNIADNYKQYSWMNDNYFLYEAKLPYVSCGERMFLNALGIDYEYEILINGSTIYHYEGMFAKTSLELTNYLTGNDILGILIYPIPRVENPELARDNVRQSCKPGVSYGWDFHPPLIPRGIWDELDVIITDTGYIKDYNIETTLSDSLDKASGYVEVDTVCQKEYDIKLSVTDLNGEAVVEAWGKNKLNYSINSPKLWWPNGYGEQSLYNFKIELTVDGEIVDSKEFKYGFKKVELLPYEGCWGEPILFPTFAFSQPLTVTVNNKRIFAQGTNWVCPKVFYGSLTEKDYEIQLKAIKNANMNMLRNWGGAIVNKEAFFRLCDEYGILLWQEFPLACNNYFDTEKYLSTLQNESTAIIKKVKNHTCLALWSGGNELFLPWSGMTMQSKALRMLDSNCLKYTPDIPFIPTSPISEFAHGDYRFRDDEGVEIMEKINKSRATGYNEMGCASMAFIDTIKYVIPEDELDKIELGTSWETHHAINAWLKPSHMYKKVLEYYFGENLSLEQMIDYSQLLQSIGYKYIYEEARRQAPKCSMILNWCFNEPWPTAANNNIFTYDNRPKPAYFAICEALRPSIPSVRYEKFEYRNGEKMNLEVWWLNQHSVEVCGDLSVTLNAGGKELPITDGFHISEKEFEGNRKLFDCGITLDFDKTQLFTVKVIMEKKNGERISSEYTMLCKA